MNQLEWSDIENMFQEEFGAPMKGRRWNRRFSALPYEMLERAIYLYAEESNRRPSIQDLIRSLPRGAVKALRPEHLHEWQTLLPLPGEGDVVVCNTCGKHNKLSCRCGICLCAHTGKKRVSARWYECPDCGATILAPPHDREEVPF